MLETPVSVLVPSTVPSPASTAAPSLNFMFSSTEPPLLPSWDVLDMSFPPTTNPPSSSSTSPFPDHDPRHSEPSTPASKKRLRGSSTSDPTSDLTLPSFSPDSLPRLELGLGSSAGSQIPPAAACAGAGAGVGVLEELDTDTEEDVEEVGGEADAEEGAGDESPVRRGPRKRVRVVGPSSPAPATSSIAFPPSSPAVSSPSASTTTTIVPTTTTTTTTTTTASPRSVTFAPDTKLHDGLCESNALFDDLVWTFCTQASITNGETMLRFIDARGGRHLLPGLRALVADLLGRLSQSKGKPVSVLPRGGGSAARVTPDNYAHLSVMSTILDRVCVAVHLAEAKLRAHRASKAALMANAVATTPLLANNTAGGVGVGVALPVALAPAPAPAPAPVLPVMPVMPVAMVPPAAPAQRLPSL